MTTPPKVSIILAAYNRADVMRIAIQSVLQSTFEDWELLIVGDGCTDHSEEVATGFDDPRISFENLPENSGGQAAPTNHALQKARGDYVMFLNQDDMYLPDHIAKSVSHLEKTGADVSWCPVFVLRRSGQDDGPPEVGVDDIVLDGVVDELGYDSAQFYIASSWIATIKSCDAVGEWHSESACRVTPSMNWLFRASQSGLKLSYRMIPTVLAIHAGTRPGSYVLPSPEHERAWTWISTGEGPLAKLYLATLANVAVFNYRSHRKLYSKVDQQVSEVADFYGVNPREMVHFLKGEEKGAFIRDIKTLTHDAPDLLPDQLVEAGQNAADIYFGEGWHLGEGNHRWSASRAATIRFTVPDEGQDLIMSLSALEESGQIRINVNGEPAELKSVNGTGDYAVFLGDAAGVKIVSLDVDRFVSPTDIGLGDDTRTLGVSLRAFRLANGEDA